MADRIFKGHLHATNSIREENQKAFSEASEEFDEPHKGGLIPFDVLYDILRDVYLSDGDAVPPQVHESDGSIWASAGDAWVKIDRNGTIEIGVSGG